MLSYSTLFKFIKEENLDGQILIKNKKVYVKNAKGSGLQPIICPIHGIKLIVNGKRYNSPVKVKEGDIIEIKPDIITREECVNVSISDDLTEAVLHTAPARITRYEILDSEASQRLEIKPLEIIENIKYIPEETIFNTINGKGINTGVIKENIKSACNTYEEKNIVIAESTPSIPSKDAWVECFFIDEGFQVTLSADKRGRVDFRNSVDYKCSNTGDVLAVKHPFVIGTRGISVTGDIIEPSKPKDITLQAGNGVIIEENGKIARCVKPGKAKKTVKGSTVIISINENLKLDGNVNIKTGNVKFNNNVEIHGSVKEAMEVSANGSILIEGDSNFAVIKSGKSLTIKGNLISSKIETGKENTFYKNPSKYIEPIIDAVDTIISNIEHAYGENPSASASPNQIGLRVKEIILSKLPRLKNDIRRLNAALKSKRFEFFHERINEITSAVKLLSGNCEFIKTVEQLYLIKAVLKSPLYMADKDEKIEADIFLSYTSNSHISSKGSVEIGYKGCFNCGIHADGNVLIKGAVRGGYIYSKGNVEINTVGSETGVPTIISVPDEGTIKIDRIYSDNIIKIGNQSYKFIEPETNVYARIVNNKLVIK